MFHLRWMKVLGKCISLHRIFEKENMPKGNCSKVTSRYCKENISMTFMEFLGLVGVVCYCKWIPGN